MSRNESVVNALNQCAAELELTMYETIGGGIGEGISANRRSRVVDSDTFKEGR